MKLTKLKKLRKGQIIQKNDFQFTKNTDLIETLEQNIIECNCRSDSFAGDKVGMGLMATHGNDFYRLI